MNCDTLFIVVLILVLYHLSQTRSEWFSYDADALNKQMRKSFPRMSASDLNTL